MATKQGGISKASVVPNARIAGLSFINRYYHVLIYSPELIYKFYRDCSLVSRQDANGLMLTGTTVAKPQITSRDYSVFKLEIKTVDSQESQNNGVIVLVSGSVTFKNNETRSFTQSFFLAPQENGYFVLNDIFKFVDEIQNIFYLNGYIVQQYPTTAEPVVKSEIVTQPQSVVIEQPSTTIAEEPAPANAVEKVEMRKREDEEGSAGQSHKVSAFEHVQNEGYSVFVSNLHANITPGQVEAEFSKFGAIKPSGVHVRSTHGGGSSYAFIEFEEAASVQAAVQAAPIPIGGRQVSVRKKRSFTGGEGFKNDGTIGCGGYSDGGRGNGSYDFVRNRRGGAGGQFSTGYERPDNQIRNGRIGTQSASGMVKRNG